MNQLSEISRNSEPISRYFPIFPYMCRVFWSGPQSTSRVTLSTPEWLGTHCTHSCQRFYAAVVHPTPPGGRERALSWRASTIYSLPAAYSLGYCVEYWIQCYSTSTGTIIIAGLSIRRGSAYYTVVLDH